MALDEKLARKLDRNMATGEVIQCQWEGKPAAVSFGDDRVVVVGAGFGKEVAAPYAQSRAATTGASSRRLRCYGVEADLHFASRYVAEEFDAAMSAHYPAPPRGSDVVPLSPHYVTTLQTMPGHRVVRVIGVVTELSAASGLTATSKGTNALEDGMLDLRRSAAGMGANAVIGLTSSAFGAAGGITGFFGGDAGGVLRVGTAVVVEPDPPAAG